jgi:glyoxylase-like metal-dependent hydrolase (beta-lactamase superfamily II)
MSHTHFDHTGNAALFVNSTWILDADERAWAFRPEVHATPAFAPYLALEHARVKLIEADADHDVFGDGTVTIIQAPGHTPGHTVLLVKLPHTGPVLLTGDMWNTPEIRAERRGTPQALASMDKVERIAAETRARVIRHHISEDFDSLPAFPEPLR